ncbi:MAG: glycosyltransferase family 2 protein [Deltaproteobacteria bacterium]|nr:glycosyltransferase family 2 protein [Deltaproteobacteria bacterium]
MKKLSVLIPVYYNEQSLPLLFDELSKVEEELSKKEIALELVFVDDGSGDGSLKELIKIKKQREETKIIKLVRNFGSMMAIKTGLGFITGDCFTIMAADLQDPPELILEMVDRWLQGAKYVICERETRDDPLSTKIFAYIYYKLLSLIVTKDYPKNGYDVALMDQDILPYLKDSGKNINISLLAFWLGFKPEVLYYHRRKREHGKSRWTFYKKLNFLLNSLLGFSVAPIRVASLMGLGVAGISFTYGLIVFLSAIIGEREVPGFAAVACLLSFLFGVVIMMLGIIGEYLWRIFDEVNKRPDSVIDEIY